MLGLTGFTRCLTVSRKNSNIVLESFSTKSKTKFCFLTFDQF